MAKIFHDDIENMKSMYELIQEENISAEEVFNAFIEWHGCFLCSKEFLENLRDSEGWNFEEEED